jgi:hypothetical protein
MEKLTHWKKNNDSRYISGEDLQHGESIGKGLQREMVVAIVSFVDSETFDQNNQSKIMKTGFNLVNFETGEALYKPVILNNTNGDFCVKEFGSEFLEHWLNKPFILFAKPDRRHGFVARFKKYYPKASATDTNALKVLNASTTIEELAENWKKLSSAEQKLPTVSAKKDELKATLNTPNND